MRTVKDWIEDCYWDYDRYNLYDVDNDVCYNYLTKEEAIRCLGRYRAMHGIDLGNRILEIWYAMEIPEVRTKKGGYYGRV